MPTTSEKQAHARRTTEDLLQERLQLGLARKRGAPPPSSDPEPDAKRQCHADALHAAPDIRGDEITPWRSTPGPYDHMPSSIPPPRRPELAQAPGTVTDPLSLSHPRWELAPAAVAGLARCGLRDMYAWQGACLQLSGVLAGERNLVFAAPTSAGKSLVADVLVLRRVLGERRKALVVVPYVSIVQERTRFFEECLAGVRVEAGGGRGRESRWRDVVVAGFHSGAKGRTRWRDLDVAVCTIERVCLPTLTNGPSNG